MAKIEGWIKNYENRKRVVWTQNKNTPLRLTAEKKGKHWQLQADHMSFEGKTRVLERAIRKNTIKRKATRVMKGMTVSPRNQSVRSRR